MRSEYLKSFPNTVPKSGLCETLFTYANAYCVFTFQRAATNRLPFVFLACLYAVPAFFEKRRQQVARDASTSKEVQEPHYTRF